MNLKVFKKLNKNHVLEKTAFSVLIASSLLTGCVNKNETIDVQYYNDSGILDIFNPFYWDFKCDTVRVNDDIMSKEDFEKLMDSDEVSINNHVYDKDLLEKHALENYKTFDSGKAGIKSCFIIGSSFLIGAGANSIKNKLLKKQKN